MSIFIEILFIFSILIIILAHIGIRIIYNELKETPNKSKLSGFEIARFVSDKVAKEEPHIIKKKGHLLDHYNYERNVIKLSEEVFDGTDIYAGIVAFTVALETDPKRTRASVGHKMSAFLCCTSYIMITIGAFLNDAKFIHFGFVLFISALVLELLILNLFGKTKKEMEETYKLAKEEKLIVPYEENKEYLILIILISIANLPYRFINYFR